jgi:hypothetical protein
MMRITSMFYSILIMYRHLKQIMDQSSDQIDHLFVNIQLFLEGVHKEIVKDAHKYSSEIPSKLLNQILYFDEDLHRFLSTIPIYYSDQELREKISNWQYFEDKMQKHIDSPKTTLSRSYSLKYFHNKNENKKALSDPSYKPKYFDAYFAPLNLEGDYDVILLHGNASH